VKIVKLLLKYMIITYLSIIPILTMKIQYDNIMGNIHQNYINTFSYFDVLFFIFIFILIHISLSVIRTINIDKFIIKDRVQLPKFFSREYFLITGFMLLSWLPYFITYFPGTGTIDEVFMMKNPIYATNQPFFYNLLLNYSWNLGKFISHETWGLGLLNLIEQIIMAVSLSFLLYWLREKGLPRIYIYINVLIFSFLPIFPNYAVCLAKDKVFSSFFIFFFLCVFDFFTVDEDVTRKIKWRILFIISAVMICLRSNSIYIFLGSIICMLFYYLYQKKSVNKILILVAVIVVSLTSFSGLFLNHQYGQHNKLSEAIGIPLQQVARTIALDGELNEQENNFFEQVLSHDDWKKLYHPCTVDTIKYNASFNNRFLDNHPKEFFTYYLSMFKNNKKIYIEAWFLNTYGFWSLTKWDRTQTLFTTSLNRTSLNLKDHNEMVTIGTQYSDNNILSQTIKNKINNFMVKYNGYISAGTCAWIYLFIIVILIDKNRYKFIFGTIPIFFCWATIILASPIAFAFRYTLFFAFLMPAILLLPFMKQEDNNNAT